ncbi:MAG: alpha/beta hydrolase [Anaerolineales bacterium]
MSNLLSDNTKLVIAVLLLGLTLLVLLGGVLLLPQALAPGEPPITPAPTATATATSTATVPASPPPTWTPAPAETPFFTPDLCPFTPPEEAVVECGFVAVPESRSGEPAGTVELAVVLYHSHAAEPAPDPVVYLSGGPGSGAIASLVGDYDDFVRPLLEERDVIVFDQRGTGFSRPSLACPEYSRVVRQDLRENFPLEEASERYTAALLNCRDRLVAEGVDLAAYTSAASAADVADLLTALGYEQANLYGVSYGTRLAQTVMRDHPERVRSAVLDSVLPIEIDAYNDQLPLVDTALNRLFDACAADPSCSAAYPDLEGTYDALVEQLNAQPVTVPVPDTRLGGTVRMDGTLATSAIYLSLAGTESIPRVPQAIVAASRGDYRGLAPLLSALPSLERALNMGVLLSINCHEEVFATTTEELAADVAGRPNVETFVRIALFGSAESLYTLCEDWGAAPFAPLEGEPLISEIPTLLIAGAWDPITPPVFAGQVAARLENSYLYEYPGLGHAPSRDAGCPFQMALDFLADPATAPDAACLQALTPPPFTTP